MKQPSKTFIGLLLSINAISLAIALSIPPTPKEQELKVITIISDGRVLDITGLPGIYEGYQHIIRISHDGTNIFSMGFDTHKSSIGGFRITY
jgi:hypothetical protein